jgi:hypothetical protein
VAEQPEQLAEGLRGVLLDDGDRAHHGVEAVLALLERGREREPDLDQPPAEQSGGEDVEHLLPALGHDGTRGRSRVLHEVPADDVVLVAESLRVDGVREQEKARILDPAARQHVAIARTV